MMSESGSRGPVARAAKSGERRGQEAAGQRAEMIFSLALSGQLFKRPAIHFEAILAKLLTDNFSLFEADHATLDRSY